MEGHKVRGMIAPIKLEDIRMAKDRFPSTAERPVDYVSEPFSGSMSKADTTNPKDLFGSVKVSLTKLPPIALVHGAHAMMDGARKYGPYNWRSKKVIASIYVDAAARHLLTWFEGQETAKDSEVHHLGHAIACCAILLDAQETGNLIDDRPIVAEGHDNDMLDEVLNRISAIVKRRKAEREAKEKVNV